MIVVSPFLLSFVLCYVVGEDNIYVSNVSTPTGAEDVVKTAALPGFSRLGISPLCLVSGRLGGGWPAELCDWLPVTYQQLTVGRAAQSGEGAVVLQGPLSGVCVPLSRGD